MTTLYQLELDQTNVNCGMSYVMQLDSGAFFIIDGGYFTPGEDERLYQFLKDQSGGRPQIAAWFFTHAHQDHVGNFIQFMWKYHDAVDIKQLLYSFQPVDVSAVTGDWKSSDPATIKEFYRTVDAYCGAIEKVTLHTGDCLAFDELAVETIYTYEDLYPEPSSFNDYSTVTTTTVGGQKILWLADAGRKAARILLERREKLACDMVQIAHHGIDSFEVLCDVYAATGARVALWPMPDYGMVDRKDQAVNRFVLHDLGIKEHLVSGYGTIAMSLPYMVGTANKQIKTHSLGRQPEPGTGGWETGEWSPFRYMTAPPVGSVQTAAVHDPGNMMRP